MSVEEKKDQFPEGMRVLAVDDDPTCLKVLEGLLRKCNYHVTTTDQAFKALEILRRNRNKYDLVISDVNMPEMDGFKLLELLGIEMDLPVIMLSGYSNVELVMKGIDHGACDYMLKPVRVEELKNIWQHVVRRKKSADIKDQKKASRQVNVCDETGAAVKGASDQNEKLHKKRKQNEEEESEDGEHETNSRQKKRMVWTKDLKMKFVAAVEELGGEKEAKPKKILELMKAEGVSRENVSSHLQKYRQHPEKAGKVALGGNSSYMRMSLLDGFRDMQPTAPPNQSPYILPGSPALSKLNQNARSCPNNDSANFRLSSTFQDPGVSFFRNHLMLQGMLQQTNSMEVFGNPTSAEVSFGIGVSGSSKFLDHNRRSENFQGGAQSSSFPSKNTLPMSEPFICRQMHTNNSGVCPSMPQVSNILNDFSAVSALSGSVDELRRNGQKQERLIGDVPPILTYMTEKRWEELPRGYNHDSHQSFNSVTPPETTLVTDYLASHTLDQSAAECSNERNSYLPDQLNGATPIFSQPSEAGKSSVEMNVKPNEDYFSEQRSLPDGSLDDILISIMEGV